MKVSEFFKKVIKVVKLRSRKKFLELGDKIGILGPEHIYDMEYYKKRNEGEWLEGAREISSVIDNEFSPESIIDFGCGAGVHLKYFYEQGKHIKGIDGNKHAKSCSVVPEEFIEIYDLRDKYRVNEKYDLVICFEVLEHIPERFDDNLVDSLADAGDIVVLSAAEPGQGGTHHINEKPREYWIKKFKQRNMSYQKEKTNILANKMNPNKGKWIPENLFVFKKIRSN